MLILIVQRLVILRTFFACLSLALRLFCFLFALLLSLKSRPFVQPFFGMPVLSTCYNNFIPIQVVGVGKKGAHYMVHGVLQNGSTRYWNYLEDYWPCAGGLSAVNAIGTQLRDTINSGLTRSRMAVQINKWTPLRNSGGIP